MAIERQVAGIDGEILTTSNKGHRVFSKLKLYGVVKSYGYWPEVKAWLIEQDLWDAFTLAQFVAEGNEQFDAGIKIFQQKFGLTDEQVEAMLDACVDGEVE